MLLLLPLVLDEDAGAALELRRLMSYLAIDVAQMVQRWGEPVAAYLEPTSLVMCGRFSVSSSETHCWLYTKYPTRCGGI